MQRQQELQKQQQEALRKLQQEQLANIQVCILILNKTYQETNKVKLNH